MTFNAKAFPQPERVFGEVTHVMIPKVGLDGTGDLLGVYRPYLTDHFSHAAESALWDLYVRKDLAVPQTR